MMKRARKLSLSRETLARIDGQTASTVVIGGNDSCLDSCYLVSCDGGCTISSGATD